MARKRTLTPLMLVRIQQRDRFIDTVYLFLSLIYKVVNGSLVQSGEHPPVTREVTGSKPVRVARIRKRGRDGLLQQS
jgi:hypothetical protein